MSVSLFSLLENNISTPRKLPRKNSWKDIKNQTNFERKHLAQAPSDAGYLNYPHGIISDINEYNTNLKKTVCSAFYSSNTSTLKATSFNREISTSPKIVGVERKKIIKYEPIYMQKRHSLELGDIRSIEELQQQTPRCIEPVEAPRTLLKVEHKQLQIPTKEQELFTPQTKLIKPSVPITSAPSNCSQEFDNLKRQSSVRDRISFFNQLSTEKVPDNCQISSTKPKSTFLSLLQKEDPRESKAYVRLSQLINKISVVRSAFRNHHRESTKKAASPDFTTARSCTHTFKFGTHSLPAPLKRKPSFEKTKPVALSIGKSLNSYGTNPRRHHLMQDLSLVVPVKFRVAEFEKNILKKH
ncbi:protein bottleneck [Eupeodes corollae]|uniref:protein bottleneck n=1 Tax=Eupeodes corollae TaxID=290404 RepID=UPI00248F5A8D|nr:protein bottleneck [Eupeodes corollae]